MGRSVSVPRRHVTDQTQEAVWLGLETGVFQVFSSDHAPFSFNDPKGKLIRGEETPFLIFQMASLD